MLSHRIEREIGVLGKEGASTQLHWYLSVLRIALHYGIIFTHIYLFTIGEKVKGLIFHSSIHFWRFMPKGEKVLTQSKTTAPPSPNFKNEVF
jgi:hypothetical protein